MWNSCARLALLSALVTSGCSGNAAGGGNAGDVDQQYQAQVDEFNRQTEVQDEMNRRATKLLDEQESDFVRTRKLLDQQESDAERTSKLLTQQESQIERYNKLLAKLEEQARRQDAIFEAEEKRLGIKQ